MTYELVHFHHIGGRILARTFNSIEEAKNALDIAFIEEDEDHPGMFDLIDTKGNTYALELRSE